MDEWMVWRIEFNDVIAIFYLRCRCCSLTGEMNEVYWRVDYTEKLRNRLKYLPLLRSWACGRGDFCCSNDSICKLDTKIGRFLSFFHSIRKLRAFITNCLIKSRHYQSRKTLKTRAKKAAWLVAVYFTSRRIQHLLICVLHMSLASSTCVLFFLLCIFFSVHSSVSLSLSARRSFSLVAILCKHRNVHVLPNSTVKLVFRVIVGFFTLSAVRTHSFTPFTTFAPVALAVLPFCRCFFLFISWPKQYTLRSENCMAAASHPLWFLCNFRELEVVACTFHAYAIYLLFLFFLAS